MTAGTASQATTSSTIATSANLVSRGTCVTSCAPLAAGNRHERILRLVELSVSTD